MTNGSVSRRRLLRIGSASCLGLAGITETTATAVADEGSRWETGVELPPTRQDAKLTPGDPEDSFGESVAMTENSVLVGAEDDDPNGDGSGAAYVFVRDGGSWTRQAELRPDDGDEGDGFGKSVAIAGDTAVVGAWNEEAPNGDRSGAVYVFAREDGSWSQRSKLAPEDGDADDQFGNSMSLSGDALLVGAVGDEDPNGAERSGLKAGAAYVFDRADGSWSQQAKLAAEDGDAGDDFGRSVALSGNTALVGARGDEDPNGEGAGSAYVFVRDGESWSQQAKLAADDGDGFDNFGFAVGLSGDIAVVSGGDGDDPNRVGQGSVYVFRRDGDEWSQREKLVASDGTDRDRFGSSLAVSETVLVVGAWQDDDPNGSAAGSAYVFRSEGGSWSQRAKLAPDDGDSSDYFGVSATVADGTAVVGADNHDGGGAYVFDGVDTVVSSPESGGQQRGSDAPGSAEGDGGQGLPGFGIGTAVVALGGGTLWYRLRGRGE